jgi:hypothetical protein
VGAFHYITQFNKLRTKIMDNAQEKLLTGLEKIWKIAANNDSLAHINQAQGKLLDVLKEKQDEIERENGSLLASVFNDINGALEDHFYKLLGSHPNVSSEELNGTKNAHDQWVQLGRLMQEHYGLSDAERYKAVSMNGFRAKYGYDGYVVRKYPAMEQYAQFVRNIMKKY